MTMYSEFDRHAAAWLRELTREGLIPNGEVDERDIREVQAADLAGHDAFHAFAGIGGWPYALRLAGWPDDRPVWTGSCPCQPFSAAGKRKGKADSRHVWPEFFRLIAECRPPTIFGEQVASDDGCVWLAGVFADLESVGYRVAGADLSAAGVGAPHIRQRLYWVAQSKGSRWRESGPQESKHNGRECEPGRTGPRVACGLGNSRGKGSQERIGNGRVQRKAVEAHSGQAAVSGSNVGRMAEPIEPRRSRLTKRSEDGSILGRSAAINSGQHWSDSTLILCRDGKVRRIPTQPGLFPLAHGIPGRVALLRGAGNSIVPQVAATFVRAVMES